MENCPVPIVYVDRPDEPGNSIIFDAERVGFIAIEHLIQHKHTNVGLIINNRKFPTSRDCYQGYLNALKHYHLVPKNEYVVEAGDFTIDAGYKAVETLLSQTTTLPTALFIAEDTLAIAAIRALKDRGIRVPQDVAIVGMNNFSESVYSDPRITSVDTSAINMGERAMAIIVRIIRGEKIESIREILPVKLVKRESCGCEVRP